MHHCKVYGQIWWWWWWWLQVLWDDEAMLILLIMCTQYNTVMIIVPLPGGWSGRYRVPGHQTGWCCAGCHKGLQSQWEQCQKGQRLLFGVHPCCGRRCNQGTLAEAEFLPGVCVHVLWDIIAANVCLFQTKLLDLYIKRHHQEASRNSKWCTLSSLPLASRYCSQA